MQVYGAGSGFSAIWLLEVVAVCSRGDGGGSEDRRCGCPGFQACHLFLQRCDLVAEFALTVLKCPEFHVRSFMQDVTNLCQAFIHFLFFQLSLEQRDFGIELSFGVVRFLQLALDAANFSVRFFLPFLPFDSSLLSLCEGLSNSNHRPFEADEFVFLVLEAMLEVVVFSF